jgi:hypothetical protein
MPEPSRINPDNPCMMANGDQYRVNTGQSQCCGESLDIVAEVFVSDRQRTITIPRPTPDQAEYLQRILDASKYDPTTVIGGPRNQ